MATCTGRADIITERITGRAERTRDVRGGLVMHQQRDADSRCTYGTVARWLHLSTSAQSLRRFSFIAMS